MDLKEFTRETLIQIVDGIVEADPVLSNHNAFVPVSNFRSNGTFAMSYSENGAEHNVINVDFDVAVSVQETSDRNNGAQISLLQIASLGYSNDKSLANQTVSRVKFSIPLALPAKNNE